MTLSEIIKAKKNGSLRVLKSEVLEDAQRIVDVEFDRVYEQIGIEGETPELVDYYELLHATADTIYGTLSWRKLAMI